MYGIFTYMYHKNQPNVGKYTSPMAPTEIFMESYDPVIAGHQALQVPGFRRCRWGSPDVPLLSAVGVFEKNPF